MVESKPILDISDADFQGEIASGVTLVDFWAEWCMPCRIQGPIVEEVAKNTGDSAKIAKLNVDENPHTAMHYRVAGIPTIILFKDGEEAKRFVGVQNEPTLTNAIKSLL